MTGPALFDFRPVQWFYFLPLLHNVLHLYVVHFSAAWKIKVDGRGGRQPPDGLCVLLLMVFEAVFMKTPAAAEQHLFLHLFFQVLTRQSVVCLGSSASVEDNDHRGTFSTNLSLDAKT